MIAPANAPSGRAVGYIRVSTRQQVESGLGLEAQRHAITEYAKAQKLELVEIYEDHVSSSVPLAKRPSGFRMCLNLQRGDLVVTKRMDRPFRSLHDMVTTTYQWKNASGVYLAVLDMKECVVDNRTAVGQMLMEILAAVAEFERAMIRERTAEALAKRNLKGRRRTIAKVGFHWKISHGKFVEVPHPETMAQIEEIHRLYEKMQSIRNVCHWVQKENNFGRFKRISSKIRRRVEGDKGFDKDRVDSYGRYRVENLHVDWSWKLVVEVLRGLSSKKRRVDKAKAHDVN